MRLMWMLILNQVSVTCECVCVCVLDEQPQTLRGEERFSHRQVWQTAWTDIITCANYCLENYGSPLLCRRHRRRKREGAPARREPPHACTLSRRLVKLSERFPTTVFNTPLMARAMRRSFLHRARKCVLFFFYTHFDSHRMLIKPYIMTVFGCKCVSVPV